MPTALNFASLSANMRAYLERGGTLDVTVQEQIPQLINLAERNIARAIKIQGFIAVVTTQLTATASTLQKPDGWRETKSFWFGDPTLGAGEQRLPLFPRSLEYCRMYWPDPTQTDDPLFYADYDAAHWLIAPTPDITYNAEINYYSLPPLLDAINSTNWLSDFAPEVLQYRAFMEMALFLKKDAGVWEAQYKEALSNVNIEDLRKIVDRTTTISES